MKLYRLIICLSFVSGEVASHKFGPKFNLSDHIWIPDYLTDVIEYGLCSSTWSTYMTALRCFDEFLRSQGIFMDLPVTVPILCRYLIYLYKIKDLSHVTITQYMSGLRFFHLLLDVSDAAFDSFLVNKVKIAIGNLRLAKLVQPPPKRCAITFPVMKLFGHELAKDQSASLWDKQIVWTCALLAYWAALRLGDIIPTGHGRDLMRIISWDKIKVVSDRQIVLTLILPKRSKGSQGVVKHIFAFEKATTYCPIANLLILYKVRSQQEGFDESDFCFVKSNGKLFTSVDMRHWIKKLIHPVLGPYYNGHSFRSGIPTLMSQFPDAFTTDDVMRWGLWNSDAHELYQRHHGVGQEKTHQKIVDRT